VVGPAPAQGGRRTLERRPDVASQHRNEATVEQGAKLCPGTLVRVRYQRCGSAICVVGDETVARVHVTRRHVCGEQYGGQGRRRKALAVRGDFVTQGQPACWVLGDLSEQVPDLPTSPA